LLPPESRWHAGLDLRDRGGSLPALVKVADCGIRSMFWRNLTPTRKRRRLRCF
jgi:hypothetical protein